MTKIFTLDDSSPLFTFSFEGKKLKQAIFVTSNSVDYFCWVTNDTVSIFDVSLNSYSKVIEIEEYDVDVRQLSFISKAERDQMYLLCLGV